MAKRRALGVAGEQAAADWYVAHGYEILHRNWRCRTGELDLVAIDGETLVFCEVKTRSSAAYGVPAAAVTPAKQRRIRTLALLWLATWEGPHRKLRFDVAAVLDGNVQVIEAAF